MKKPIPSKYLIGIMAVIIVILALALGFVNSLYELEALKYKRLEDKYVRVRSQLGIEATQDLIDASYE